MSNEKSWLVKRLTPRQKKEPRWVQLAETIEEFWDQNFEPNISDYENLRSAFTASEDGIDLKLAEAGIKFEAILPISPTGKAVAYAQRGYEIHRKDRKASLEQILQREFRGSVFRWMPLYALPEDDYGDRFYNEIEVKEFGFDKDEIYLTSRGKALVNVTAAHGSGLSKQEVVDAVARNFEEIRPAHIVYDGVIFISIFIIVIQPIVFTTKNIIRQWHQMDSDDFKKVSHKHESKREYTIDFSQWLNKTPWRLDMGWIINGKLRRLQGLEGDIIDTIAYLGSDHASFINIPFDPTLIPSYAGSSSVSAITANPDPLKEVSKAQSKIRFIHGNQNKDYFEKPWRLDMGWIINGKFRRLKGLEGDIVDFVSNLGSDHASFINIPFDPTLIPSYAGSSSVSAITANPDPLKEVSKAQSKIRFIHGNQNKDYFEKPWRLDMGWIINGKFRRLKGLEGDIVDFVSNLGSDHASFINIPFDPLLLSKSMTLCKLNKAKVVELESSNKSIVTVKYTIKDVELTQKMPSLDDVPSDFAPLDLYYGL